MSSATASILIVDADEETRAALEQSLASQGYAVDTASDVAQAMAKLGERCADLIISDPGMPGTSGLDLVRHVRENLQDTAILVVTAQPSIAGAVEAIRSGAEDFLTKPLERRELLASVERALARLRTRRSGSARPVRLRHGLVGECPALHQAIDLAERVAGSSVPILIQGEHGTGRESLARAVHFASPRGAHTFYTLDALEAHEYPSFDADVSLQERLHTRAHGGTLFIRNIEGSSRRLQAALAVLLAEGADGDRTRAIATTSADLAALATQGRFDQQLLYALRACTITLPPLRERGDDLRMLVQHFTQRSAAVRGREVCRFSDSALDTLRAYAWPGNIHELRCIVERVSDLAGDEVVDVPDLPPLMRFSALSKRTPFRSLAEVTAEYIAEVLTATDGNISHAAEILDITRKTLREKLKRAHASTRKRVETTHEPGQQ
jgi:two-component system, NtrC family, response regulator HydG